MKTIAFLTLTVASALALATNPIDKLVKAQAEPHFAIAKSDTAWQHSLPPSSYLVLRKAGTERAYTGKYWDFHGKGIFVCAGCGQTLFSSDTKFDSHTGWPSFYREIARGHTLTRPDLTGGDERTEVICARCGGHLGHVFADGPEPTGLRYCMNSPALVFSPRK